ncbi:aaa family ATPase [Fusarium mundagurra]|uniref:Aaa family ATPase n=1 Tax=Fusarium mundagurra TaxID=1567541 RepID=A0A8H6D117_9HYPO|nr:aaa family ATPase [Fusarium mundagurra]
MEENIPKDYQNNVTLRASDNEGISGDADAGSVREQRTPAEIQIHKRLTEMKKKLRRVDELVIKICHLKDEIAHDLNTFFEELPTSLPSRSIEGDDDSNVSDLEPSAKSANGDDPQLLTVPRIRFRAWKELDHHSSVRGESAPEPIDAMEIPSDELIGTFKPGAPWDRMSEIICDPSGQPIGIPERLQINSTRLKLMLHGFDASLDSQKSIASSLPLTILRPFKILDYHYSKMKNLLKSLEEEANSSKLNPESRRDTASGGAGETITTATDQENYINDIHCLIAYLDERIVPLSKRVAEEADVVRFSELCLARRSENGWSEIHEKANENFDSDVVTDYHRALEHNPAWRPPTDDPQLYAADHAELGQMGGVAQDIDQDWKWDKKLSNEILAKLRKRLASWTNPADVPDREYLLLLPDRVFGYVLDNHKWASLRVGSTDEGDQPLLPIATDEDPWKQLYLPTQHKEIIRSLLEQKFQNSAENENMDLVRGKGHGLIILLHGPPGVGKTFTAKCAAVATKRPLFSITCGDLGISAENIEKNLSEFFRLSHAWGCVLLLDEADVFLSSRKREDVLRNSLASVFLRSLEYYPSILFLTTNRARDFDEAFASRIHISLYYPALDLQGTCVIWNNMLSLMKRRHRGMLADDEALLDYARELYKAQPSRGGRWNGRQIRNALQSVVAIADFEKEPGSSLRLTKDQFKKVSQSYDEFNRYRFSIIGDSIPASEDAVIELRSRYAQHHRDREAPGASLAHSTSSLSSSGHASPWRPHKKTDNGKELQSIPLIPPLSSNVATQEQQSSKPEQSWNQTMSSLDVQPQSPYAPPGWAPIQNIGILPIGMGYSPMGVSVPMPMAAPFQCHNATMNPYNLGGTGSPFQLPPNTPGVTPQYSQFANHFQSQPIVPQATQSQSSQLQPSRPGLGQALPSQSQLGKESGGGFWGRFNYDDQASHPSAWQSHEPNVET